MSSMSSSISGHPRACGENYSLAWHWRRATRAIPARAGRTQVCEACGLRVYGPSPRVRGEPLGRRPTPARIAGHPRACGENFLIDPMIRAAWRAIPARAGRTSAPVVLPSAASGPSPRVRGELELGKLEAKLEAGHPRACGENPGDGKGSAIVNRAIPARAGRTRWPMRWPLRWPGPSPRVRGERL